MNFCNYNNDEENKMDAWTSIIGIRKHTNVWSEPCCEKMAQKQSTQEKISTTIEGEKIQLEIPYSIRLSMDKCSLRPTSECTTLSTESTTTSLIDIEEDLEELFHDNEEEVKKNKKVRQNKNGVRFSTVEIRQYEQCIGDSPAVTEGPPISLSWEYRHDDVKKYGLNEYEEIILQGKERQRQDELIIPRRFRERKLYEELGYSRADIQSVMKEISISRDERMDTRNSLFLAGIEEWCEEVHETLIGNPLRKATYSILGSCNHKVQHLKRCEEFTQRCCRK